MRLQITGTSKIVQYFGSMVFSGFAKNTPSTIKHFKLFKTVYEKT